jgi:hypothetical protein
VIERSLIVQNGEKVAKDLELKDNPTLVNGPVCGAPFSGPGAIVGY